MLYRLARILLKPFLWLWYCPKVYNRKALRRKGKVIYVANHLSTQDPIAVGLVTPRNIHFMAKSPLFERRLNRILLTGMLCFPVSQRMADLKSIKHAVELLEQGEAFGIFPEGHRSVGADMTDDFDKGAAFIALRADAPIVPMYLRYKKQFFGRLCVAVGEPIFPEEVKARCKGKKAVDALNLAMMHEMLRLRETAEEM